MTQANVASREEWLAARQELLEQEKAFLRQRDALSEQRRQLPWVKVEEDYTFDTDDGPRSLADLFGDKSQLIVQHFMLGEDWEAGCPSCSFWADGFDGTTVHLENRDAAFWRWMWQFDLGGRKPASTGDGVAKRCLQVSL